MLLWRVERLQRYIAKRALGVGSPVPIGIYGSRQTITSSTQINFAEKSIQVTLTDDGHVAGSWVYQQTGQKIVGLDMEWRPCFNKGSQNKTALLQLCTDNGCLIIQMLFLDFMPEALVGFLKDPEIKFVGSGVRADVAKLKHDYGLECGGPVELGHLAAEKFGRQKLKQAGLRGLAIEVLGLNISKPKRVYMSNWASRKLRERQVEYACIDSFVSFSIGKKLLEPEN